VTLPERLGPYVIERELGRGAMGQVWQARHAELGHVVALKVLPPELSDNPMLRARFGREAAAAARLADIPGVVGVHDHGEDGGQAWFAMDLVAGRSLEAALVEGEWGVPQIVDCFVALARSLQAAHERGVLHRDLKPANIMIEIEPDGTPRITDFGLARCTAADPEVTRLTQSGEVLGTPAYMPPEQVKAQGVDARSDVYALGATLYEALSGRPPFDGDTVLAVMAQVLRAEPPPLRTLRHELPKALTDIVAVAMAKDSADRYQSAAELAADLERFRDNRAIAGIVVRRLSPGTKRAGWAAAGVGAAAALFGVIAIAGRSAEEATTQERAEVRAETALAERARDYAAAAAALEARAAQPLRALQDRWHGAPAEPAALEQHVADVRRTTAEVRRDHPASGLPDAWDALAAFYASSEPEPPAALEALADAGGEDPFVQLLAARVRLSLIAESMYLPLWDRWEGEVGESTVSFSATTRAHLEAGSARLRRLAEDPVWARLSHAPYLSAYLTGALALGRNEAGAAAAALADALDDPLFDDEARALLATALYLTGDVGGAAAQYEAVGRRRWRVAHLDAALAAFEQARRASKDMATRAEHLQRARGICDAGLTVWNYSAHFLWVRGAVLVQLGEAAVARGEDPEPLFRAAVTDLSPIVERHPDAFPDAVASRSVAWDRWAQWERSQDRDPIDKHERAFRDAESWAALNPECVRAWEPAARPASMAARVAVASVDLGRDPGPWVTRGVALCDAWAAQWPDHGRAWAERARLRFAAAEWTARQGRLDQAQFAAALADTAVSVEKLPESYFCWYTRQRLLERYSVWLGQAGLQDPANSEASLAAADAMVRYAATDADRGEALTARGGVRANLAQDRVQAGTDPSELFAGAVADLMEAARLLPNELDAGRYLAITFGARAQWLITQGRDGRADYAAAVAAFAELAGRFPNSAGLWRVKGGTGLKFAMSERECGRDGSTPLAEAIRDLQAATRLEPSDATGWFWLGEAHFEEAVLAQGRGDSRLPGAKAALAAYEQALKCNPAMAPQLQRNMAIARKIVAIGR
jgi:serine/threonine-protein kinase